MRINGYADQGELPHGIAVLLHWGFAAITGFMLGYNYHVGVSLLLGYFGMIPIMGSVIYYLEKNRAPGQCSQVSSYRNALVWPGYVLLILWKLLQEITIGVMRWIPLNILGFTYWVIIFSPCIICGYTKINEARLTRFFKNNLSYCLLLNDTSWKRQR